MKTYELNGYKVLFVPVPVLEGILIEFIGYYPLDEEAGNQLFFSSNNETIVQDIPAGNWQFIATTKDITQEQAFKLTPSSINSKLMLMMFLENQGITGNCAILLKTNQP